MNIQEFKELGYSIERVITTRTKEKVEFLEIDRNRKKYSLSNQGLDYSLKRENNKVKFYIVDKNEVPIDVFYCVEDMRNYIENMPSPKKEWELDEDEWHDLLNLSHDIRLSRHDSYFLSEVFNSDLKNKEIKETAEYLRIFKNIEEFITWVYSTEECLVFRLVEFYHLKEINPKVTIDLDSFIPNHFILDEGKILFDLRELLQE